MRAMHLLTTGQNLLAPPWYKNSSSHIFTSLVKSFSIAFVVQNISLLSAPLDARLNSSPQHMRVMSALHFTECGCDARVEWLCYLGGLGGGGLGGDGGGEATGLGGGGEMIGLGGGACTGGGVWIACMCHPTAHAN